MTVKKFVCLSHAISEDMPVFKGHLPVEIKDFKTINKDGRSLQEIRFSNHIGTHMDAPSHFIPGGKTVDALESERLMGSAAILDFTFKGKGDRLTGDDLRKFGDIIHEKSRILLKTGWDRKFYQDDYFDSFPCLTLGAADYLVSKRIGLLGMDTPSPGPLGSEGDAIHKSLLSAGIIILESLKDLVKVDRAECELIAFPLPLAGCSGAPCMAAAVLPVPGGVE